MAIKLPSIPRRISNRSDERELGFGRFLITGKRLMNPDGSFNVERLRDQMHDNLYHNLITMPWWEFTLLMFFSYLILNTFFALIYLSLGVEHLSGIETGSLLHNFMEAYFFSTQTLTTVGYGRISPLGLPANIVAAVESFTGLLAFALISGLLYGRFSRPTAKIMFSDNILVAPYKEGKALMFRMANARRSELLETEVQMIIALNQPDDKGQLARNFYALPLEINKVSFFSMSWTLVHALTEASPLYGFSQADLMESTAEILILVKGVDETNQQLVHARRSYIAEEIVWNARFAPVIARNGKGFPQVQTHKIGAYESLGE